MFQDAVWCLVHSSDPSNWGQVHSCRTAAEMPEMPEPPERPLGADELSDFFPEFRKLQSLNEKIHLCNESQTHVFHVGIRSRGERTS